MFACCEIMDTNPPANEKSFSQCMRYDCFPQLSHDLFEMLRNINKHDAKATKASNINSHQ